MDSERRRDYRVLVIAEACNPAWTSVPLVGYQLAGALARRPDLRVTLVTHVRNRAALEGDPIGAAAELHFVDNERIARPLYKLSSRVRGGQSLSWTIDTALAWPSYMVFERMVHRAFAARLAGGGFDLIHRVTPLSPTMGSPLAGLTDVPMLIGPLNGGLPWPKQHPHLRRREREWLTPLREAYKHLPYYRSTYRKLAGVISGSRHTATEVPADFAGLRAYLPENGIDPGRFPIAGAWPEPRGRFRFITVGRLVPYKGTDLILEAIRGSALLRSCELQVVGDGPMRAELEGLTARYGLEDCVKFAGWIGQRELAASLRAAQAFVFPSLREFGGGVVLEAMACALPSIVVDYGGPAELVDDDSGILLPMATAGELIPNLRRAMESLALDHGLCRAMGHAAGEQVRRRHTWDSKADRIVRLYDQLIERRRGGAVRDAGPADVALQCLGGGR